MQMDTRHSSDDTTGLLTLNALDSGSLQELFSRCSSGDLWQLRLTCTLFDTLLRESQLVWARRLWADFGIRLFMKPNISQGDLFSFARTVYTSSPDTSLRFQGSLVNGSVDGQSMWYWVDNLFKRDSNYFCSDSSANVDCVGLLLDGYIPRETTYNTVRTYMQRRCRYAAALFEQLHNPGEANVEGLMSLVETWTDLHLERFFISLVTNLQDENPMGRLLFYDIPQDRMVMEEERLRGVAAYIRDRMKVLKRGIVAVPGDLNTLFDTSVVDKVGRNDTLRSVGIVRELHLSRAGSLTCPVAAGVVMAGIIDHTQLQGLSPAAVGKAIQGATQDAVCTAFNGLETWEAVEEQIEDRTLPTMTNYSRTYTGTFCEFDASWDEDAFSSRWLRESGGPLVTWKPLVWFRFHSREEAEQIASSGIGAGAGNNSNTSAVQQQQQQGGGENGAVLVENGVMIMENLLNGGQAFLVGGNVAQPQQQPQLDAVEGQPVLDNGENGDDIDIDIGGGGGGDGVVAVQGEDDEEEEENEENEDDEDDVELGALMLDHTAGRNELDVKLSHPVAANIVLVKLINQENLMEELMDMHAYPNIDMTNVEVYGNLIRLPKGLDVKGWP